MTNTVRRSDCPISNVLDHVGDKWSLLIIRDLIFFGKQSFSEFQNSDEKVATNILSKRLESLELDGLITREVDPNDKRKKVYSLTTKGKDLLPILLEMMLWSDKYDPDTDIPTTFLKKLKKDRESVISEMIG